MGSLPESREGKDGDLHPVVGLLRGKGYRGAALAHLFFYPRCFNGFFFALWGRTLISRPSFPSIGQEFRLWPGSP